MNSARPVKGRHQARKRAVDLLFEAEARGLTAAEAADARTALAAANDEVAPPHPYTVAVAHGVTENAAHVDDLISSHLQGWTLDRLPAVDRAILRVAVFELLHADDVPAPVAVDEAVELAKELSTDDSPGFVNGVLGQVMLVTPQIRAAAEAVRASTMRAPEGARGGDGPEATASTMRAPEGARGGDGPEATASTMRAPEGAAEIPDQAAGDP